MDQTLVLMASAAARAKGEDIDNGRLNTSTIP
jgi:hypothetical protein